MELTAEEEGEAPLHLLPLQQHPLFTQRERERERERERLCVALFGSPCRVSINNTDRVNAALPFLRILMEIQV